MNVIGYFLSSVLEEKEMSPLFCPLFSPLTATKFNLFFPGAALKGKCTKHHLILFLFSEDIGLFLSCRDKLTSSPKHTGVLSQLDGLRPGTLHRF